jgi:hypothetical protein
MAKTNRKSIYYAVMYCKFYFPFVSWFLYSLQIPQSAVEMPGDAINSSIGYLDVQFGGLEFGSETSSFETTSEQSKYTSNVSGSVLDSVPSPRTTSNLDLSGTNQTSVLEAYSGTSQKTSQPGIASALTQNQKVSDVFMY